MSKEQVEELTSRNDGHISYSTGNYYEPHTYGELADVIEVMFA